MKYHENKLKSNLRIDYLDPIYRSNYRVHAKISTGDYVGLDVACALGLTLSWLEGLGEIEKVSNATINDMMDYILDVCLFIAFQVNIHEIDIVAFHEELDKRIPKVSYATEQHYEDNVETVNTCFAIICSHISSFCNEHYQMTTCIALNVIDMVRNTPCPGSRIDMHILLDVLSTIKFVANKVSNERKSSYDFANIFSGTDQKDSNSI